MNTGILKWIGIFIVCFALQTTIVPVIEIAGIKPDLLLVALFFLSIRFGQMTAVWVGFFLGLSQDLFTPSILGQNALAKAVAAFLAGFFNERVMRLDIVFRMVLMLVVFAVNDLLLDIIQFVKTGGGRVFLELVTVTIPRALYSMLFALVPYLKERLLPTSFRR
jgi:rod shape-determining protein MreD